MSLTIQQSSQSDMVRSMAAYLPGGELFSAAQIPGTNFNALLLGLSGELLRAENFLFLYNSQFIPDNTDVFITEWESALGIPDDCFSGTGTNAERRRDILVKLASLGVQTGADFENLAVILGFEDVEVLPGLEAIIDNELVTNGGFDTDTNWVKGTGWSISGGVAVKTAGTASSLTQAFSTNENDIYVLSFDMASRTAGKVSISLSGGASVDFDNNTSLKEPLTAGSGPDGITIAADAAFNGTIDNVSVKPLISDITVPRFTIYVSFPFEGNNYPLKYAYEYGTSAFRILECLYAKLKPANCDIIFAA